MPTPFDPSPPPLSCTDGTNFLFQLMRWARFFPPNQQKTQFSSLCSDTPPYPPAMVGILFFSASSRRRQSSPCEHDSSRLELLAGDGFRWILPFPLDDSPLSLIATRGISLPLYKDDSRVIPLQRSLIASCFFAFSSVRAGLFSLESTVTSVFQRCSVPLLYPLNIEFRSRRIS